MPAQNPVIVFAVVTTSLASASAMLMAFPTDDVRVTDALTTTRRWLDGEISIAALRDAYTAIETARVQAIEAVDALCAIRHRSSVGAPELSPAPLRALRASVAVILGIQDAVRPCFPEYNPAAYEGSVAAWHARAQHEAAGVWP